MKANIMVKGHLNRQDQLGQRGRFIAPSFRSGLNIKSISGFSQI
jgi:hypothetical protein